MARRIDLTGEDIEQMETDLTHKRAELAEEQVHFLEYLLGRAKAGQKASGRQAIAWEWSYDFYAAPTTK